MSGRQSTVLKSKNEQPARRPSVKRKAARGLNAFSIAEREHPSTHRLARHRFGVEEDDGPKRKRDGDDDPSTKRRRTGDDDDSVEGGSDSDGNEWQMGNVDSDDDSEIDSDDALGSSDEERFEGFSFRGSAKPKKPRKKTPSKPADDVDMDEEFEGLSEKEPEEEEDDDLGEEAVDLATAWDMNADESEEETPKKKSTRGNADSSDEPFSEDDDESGDESDLSISDDEDEIKQRGLSKLKKFVSALEPEQADSSKSKSKYSATLPGGNPSEYGLMPTRKLTVADLIPTITDSRLKGSLKHIEPTSTSSKSKLGKLDAPLAKRQQDRIDRSAAYDKSKETLDRWIDTVKANRRAEHLSFPLPEPNAPQQARMVESKPRTDLESTIQNILVESGLAETNGKSAEGRLLEIEEREINKLPVEEIQARRAELRKARELMFREEARSKRIKKIKSKSYRRVHRREREKMDMQEREALAAAGVDLEEEDRELQDRKRAESRMGTKHKDSKWAKSLQQTGRTAWDEDARLSMADLAHREDELRKRIEGKTVRADDEFLGSSSDDSDDESDGPEDGFGSDDEGERLKKKLRRLENDGVDGEEVTGPHAKLMSMKFMQNADASRKAANDAEIRRLNRELGEGGSQSETEDAEPGRQKFGTQKNSQPADKVQPPAVQRGEFEEPESDDERRVPSESNDKSKLQAANNNKIAQKTTQKLRGGLSMRAQSEGLSDLEENPWLSEQKGPRKKKGTGSDQTDISVINPSEPSRSSGKPKNSKDAGNKRQGVLDDSDEEKDEQDRSRGPMVLQNEDLVKRAFAGDEVLEDFTKEKLDTVEDEGDQVVEDTLPGWGSWAGTGLSKREKKQVKRTFTKVEGIQADKRKDAKMDRVIINEKRIKKVCLLTGIMIPPRLQDYTTNPAAQNTKYMASQLPHPFETRAQYERSLRLPIGPEWTTKETFQDATKPRVMIKQGVIRPMQRPAL